MDYEKKEKQDSDPSIAKEGEVIDHGTGELLNASGHVQELRRHFSLLSLAGVGITVGNVWPAVGGSILVALYNGGPPGVLYQFIVVSVFYWLVAASIAELASAIPSSAGVYQWASITPGPRWGRVIGFFAGYWNWLAWVFGAASMSLIFVSGFASNATGESATDVDEHRQIPSCRCTLSSMRTTPSRPGTSSSHT